MQFSSYYLDSPLIKGRIFDVFEPETITKDVAIFLVHGGGWRNGSRENFHVLMEEFCRRGYIVASTDYRLNAKNAFEQLSDIRASYDKFVSVLKAKKRPIKIAIYGSSAGAHLASLLLCANPGECGECNNFENEWIQPVLGIFQSSPVHLLPWEGMMPHAWNAYQNAVGVPYEQNPEPFQRLSLINYVKKDNPPIFFIEAEREHEFCSEDTLKIVKQHRAWGIPSHWKVYEKMEHGFLFELKRNAQKAAFEDFCLFLEGKLETF